jgi:hypothetical protein
MPIEKCHGGITSKECDMKFGPLNRFAVVGAVLAVLLVNLQLATSQSQQRVQSTTQFSVKTPLVADPMADWEQAYDEAMKVVRELEESGRPDDASRLENDLNGLDQAIRAYVRVSERLRHKDRAYAKTMEFLVAHNAMQMESRRYQTIANALTAAHQAENATVRNLK